MSDPVVAPVDIANRALAMIGSPPITSLEDDTDRARAVLASLFTIIDTAHALYHWKWARKRFQLDKSADVPLGWKSAFVYPNAALSHPLGLYTDPKCQQGSLLRDYDTEGRTVLCNAESLYGRFIIRQDPSLWPPGFTLAVTTWLAASFAVPETHDVDLGQSLLAQAIGNASEGMRGGLIGRAIAVDVATGGAEDSLTTNEPVTSARFDGPGILPWHGNY